MDAGTVLFALGLTLFAGLSTGIGSIIAFRSKKTNETFLSAALGFSAGVMIYVSMIEIFAKSRDVLVEGYGSGFLGNLITTVAFFGGIGVIAFIDKVVPSAENPHEIRDIDDIDDEEAKRKSLLRMGLFSALAIAIHNFPEGLATFLSALENPTLGISIAVAIAIHNIPEGISVSVPIYFATGSKKKAFWYSFASGLSEPIGALLGYLLLVLLVPGELVQSTIFGIVFAGVAGIMVYISLDELLPTAEKYGKHHVAIGGLIAGMAVMALSLVMFYQ